MNRPLCGNRHSHELLCGLTVLRSTHICETQLMITRTVTMGIRPGVHSNRPSMALATGLALWLSLALGAAHADVKPAGSMLRYPDVSKSHIVFSYANDLWLVPRAGGEAIPLTSPDGFESSPRFSPDGETLAFVGNYDGARDIYTISVKGGVPQRLTYHPAGKILCDWTPDGALLFSTNGYAGLAAPESDVHRIRQEPAAHASTGRLWRQRGDQSGRSCGWRSPRTAPTRAPGSAIAAAWRPISGCSTWGTRRLSA